MDRETPSSSSASASASASASPSPVRDECRVGGGGSGGGGGGGGDGNDGGADVDEVTRQLQGLRVQPPGSVLQKPQVQRVDTAGRRFVYFDLETTGLEEDCHITQIAACSGEDEGFSVYVLPKIPINKGAQQLTGLTVSGPDMFLRGQPVPCLGIQDALEQFIDFLGQEPAVLLGHNILRFDCPRLLNALQACGLVERFRDTVHGFVDTYPLFKDINTDAESYKLTWLHEYYTGEKFPAHDAREDVRALQRVVDEADPSSMSLLQHSFSLQYVLDEQRYKDTKARLLPAWKELVARKVISRYMADKASGSGLSWDHVRSVFLSDGEEAARQMLKKRLTNRVAIIASICNDLRKRA